MTTPPPRTRPFRVATWNMDHWKRTVGQREAGWVFLQDAMGVDVALLQECVPPDGLSRDRVAYREIGGGRPWGSAVASFRDDLEVEEVGAVRTRWGSSRFLMLSHRPGGLMVARTQVPDVGPVTLVSLYGVVDRYYYQTTILRFVADLIPLFDSPEGERVILGGDFNLTDAVAPTNDQLPRYRAILGAVESLGLKNLAEVVAELPPPPEGCPCGSEERRHLRTYDKGIGPQLDWLFATPELAHRCRSLRVEWDGTRELSDHAPIVADFDLPVGDPSRKWDPKSFVREVAVRSGPGAGRVAAEIVAWAGRRHEELRLEGRSFASLDRLPTSTGEVPELWIQLDLRDRSTPGFTVSMTADGRIIVQFQWMQYPPFDTEEGRGEVWARLTALPGLALDRRLNGRPWFPISVLEEEGNLERFLEVLGWMVEEVVGREGSEAT